MGCKNICEQYKAVKLPQTGRYSAGQKRCQICSIFLKWEGNHCPCCGYRLRNKPRNSKYKRSFSGTRTDSNMKVEYVGSGKDPKLKPFIDKDYLKAVPRLPHRQFIQLQESIIEDGLQNPITVNPQGKVLDGHTRYQICSDHGIVLKYIVKKFKTIDEERRYVIVSNLKRRQLTNFQIIELSQTIRRSMNDEAREKTAEYLSKLKSGKVVEKVEASTRLENSTRYKLAVVTGLSPATVDKANYVIDHGNKEEIIAARSGAVSLEQVYNKVKNRRHADPSTIKRNNRVFPTCEKCGGDTRFRGKCHVHKQFCCRKCSWGK